MLTDKAIPQLQSSLLAWFRANRRDLPWRNNPSLYKTVVSEFMLQQTQVKTVLPYFDRWLQALPDFQTLAAAPESKVLKLWEGLGYYTRARNLHKLAQKLITLPSIPATPRDWQELPGIGPYTAAAITSISFNAPAACVDGNIIRILARLTADQTIFGTSTDALKKLTPLAQRLLNPKHPGLHNEAMMELGALICRKPTPDCSSCPISKYCQSFQQQNDLPSQLPRFAPKQIEKQTITRILCIHQNKILLHKTHKSSKRLADLHELPSLSDLPNSKTKLSPTPLLTKTRAITRYQITENFHLLPIPPQPPLPPNLIWHPIKQLDALTFSGPHRRWLPLLLKTQFP